MLPLNKYVQFFVTGNQERTSLNEYSPQRSAINRTHLSLAGPALRHVAEGSSTRPAQPRSRETRSKLHGSLWSSRASPPPRGAATSTSAHAGGLNRSTQHFLSSCSEGSGRGGEAVEADAGGGRRGLGSVAFGSGGEGAVAADAGEPVDGAGPAASHGWDQAGAEAAVGAAAVAGRAGGDLTRVWLPGCRCG